MTLEMTKIRKCVPSELSLETCSFPVEPPKLPETRDVWVWPQDKEKYK